MELNEARLVVAEALAGQELEVESGYTVGNAALYELEQGAPARVIELVSALWGGTMPERQLGARLLSQSTVSGTVMYGLAVEALETESDPEILSWWVRVLQRSKQPSALEVLNRLSRHQDAGVRHAVPDALSWCSGGDFDRVAESLLRLAEDDDAEVRWSALFELRTWSQESDDARIVARLATVSEDPSAEVRDLLRFYDDGSNAK